MGHDVEGRTKRFGTLLNRYRTATLNPQTGRYVTQKWLADELAALGHVYDESAVSRWESQERLPPSQAVIEGIASVLKLSTTQKNELLSAAKNDLLVAAGHAPIEERTPTELLHRLMEQVANLTQQVNALYQMMPQQMNPAGRPIIPTDPVSIIGSGAQRAALPGLYIAGVGLGLNALNVQEFWVLALYAGAVSMAVTTQGLYRVQRSRVREQAAADIAEVQRGYWIGELLFISLFVTLNTPLLLASMTGMDLYGFFTIESLTGTPLPLLCVAMVDLFVGLVGAAVFHALWLWQYSKRKEGPAYARAIRVMLPTIVLVYVPVALLSVVGGETYFLIIDALLFGAFLVIITYSDPEVKLGEWEAKLSVVVALGAMFLLFLLAIIGMLILYLGEFPVPPGNHLWAWEHNWTLLGYGPEVYAGLQRSGIVWMILAGIAYMLLVVGGYMLVTIYRYQVAPYVKKKESGV